MSNPVSKVIIAGNWKMYKTRSEGRQLAEEIKNSIGGQTGLPEIILIPPFTCLQDVGTCVKGSAIELGAQNMDYHDNGAYTGEISPIMLTDLGVKYVLIGHSERRQYFGETNASTNLRLKAALSHGLAPILCVGESLDEREAKLTDAVISRQVAAALADVDQKHLPSIYIAYEPVWAIGTGKNCQASEANRVAGMIRSTVAGLYPSAQSKKFNADSIPVLYGGSVKPSNIDEQLNESQINGALVGGASLRAEEFLALIQAGQKRLAQFSQAIARC